MIDRTEKQIIASSNIEKAIKALYYTLLDKYKLSDNEIELYISHTSIIYIDPEVFENYYELDHLKSYCEGFIDGIDEIINQGIA